MRKISRGQSVKRFKDAIPQPDQTLVEAMTSVYFKADEGKFYIYLPAHIDMAIKSGVEGLGNSRGDVPLSYVRANVLADVLAAWDEVKEKYGALLRAEGAVKVIRYQFQAQKPGQPLYGDPWSFHMGHSPGPGVALILDYEILWRSGCRLYYGHYEDGNLKLQDKGPLPGPDSKAYLIDWTEEREQFFVAMKAGVISIIERFITFLEGDVVAQINAVMSGTIPNPLLAAPKVEIVITDRHWARQLKRVIGFSETYFLATQREEFVTVRQCAVGLALTQKDVLALAEDAKGQGLLEINTGVRNAGGMAEFTCSGDYQLEPIMEAANEAD